MNVNFMRYNVFAYFFLVQKFLLGTWDCFEEMSLLVNCDNFQEINKTVSQKFPQ